MNQPGASTKRRILVAPLDWGLGHATRCIPLIHKLLEKDCSVYLAGEGPTARLLEAEFPNIPILPLPGYNIRYARSGGLLPLSILTQIPKIRAAVQYENQRLRHWVKELRLNAVISDNRYGLFHPSLTCIILTHQLRIQTGLGSAADALLQRLHYRFLRPFTECWVPDTPSGLTLAGSLSHPRHLPSIPLRYLGPLSRFSAGTEAEGSQLLVLLSGPEPLRTVWENALLRELASYSGPALLVRGLPGKSGLPSLPSNIRVVNHLPATELERELKASHRVVARCGYSTVMDLLRLKKKSILVPTPGQTEQQYLATHLMREGLALTLPQSRFRLRPALDLSQTFPYQLDRFTGSSHLDAALSTLFHRIDHPESTMNY